MPNGIPSSGDRRRRGGFGEEALGFTLAEGISMGVSLVTVGIADILAPGLVKKATHVVAKVVIEPHLDIIERSMKKVCHINECQADERKSRQERAENLARAVVLFTPAWALSLGVKFWVRRKWNGAKGIEEPPIEKTGKWYLDKVAFKMLHPNEWKIGLADEGVHYGSLIYFNTKGAEYTSDLIKATSTMLQKKTGMSKRKADDLASVTMIWEMPNILGLGAGIGVIYGKHKWGWGDQRKGSHFERH